MQHDDMTILSLFANSKKQIKNKNSVNSAFHLRVRTNDVDLNSCVWNRSLCRDTDYCPYFVFVYAFCREARTSKLEQLVKAR